MTAEEAAGLLGKLHLEAVEEWETRTVRETIARDICKPARPKLDLEVNREWHADGHLPKVE